MAMGVPGWPELAVWTASIARVRMVLMAVRSILDFSFLRAAPALAGSDIRVVTGGAPSCTSEVRRGGRGPSPDRFLKWLTDPHGSGRCTQPESVSDRGDRTHLSHIETTKVIAL